MPNRPPAQCLIPRHPITERVHVARVREEIFVVDDGRVDVGELGGASLDRREQLCG